MEHEEMNDALGNEIIIGQKYGYSAKDTVFIGIAEKLTKTRVTLKTLSRRAYRYGEEVSWRHEMYPAAPFVSVPSFHLFPINEPNKEPLK
jgi:hypothetical protein